MKLYEIQYIKDLIAHDVEEKRKAYDEALTQQEQFTKVKRGRLTYFDVSIAISEIDAQEFSEQAKRVKDSVEKKNRALIDAMGIADSFNKIEWTIK